MRALLVCAALVASAFGYHQRCGITEYNTDLALCCDNAIVHNPQGLLRCCNNMGYDPNIDLCHNGWILRAAAEGGEYGGYNRGYFGASAWNLLGETQSSPGQFDTARLPAPYAATTHYDDMETTPKPPLLPGVPDGPNYCGAMKIVHNIFLCCEGAYFANPTTELSCCGGRAMDAAIYQCVGSEIQPKYRATQPYASMCGNVVPVTNPEKELCCGGFYVQNPINKFGCCNGHVFDTEFYNCGGDKPILVQEVSTYQFSNAVRQPVRHAPKVSYNVQVVQPKPAPAPVKPHYTQYLAPLRKYAPVVQTHARVQEYRSAPYSKRIVQTPYLTGIRYGPVQDYSKRTNYQMPEIQPRLQQRPQIVVKTVAAVSRPAYGYQSLNRAY